MIKGHDRWDYPMYLTDKETDALFIFEDWNNFELSKRNDDLYADHKVNAWLHGYEDLSFPENWQEILLINARLDLQDMKLSSFEPKPSKDIRKEKTRDYRKRRPKYRKYSDEIATNVAIVYCLTGLLS